MAELKAALAVPMKRITDEGDRKRVYHHWDSRYGEMRGKGRLDKEAWCREAEALIAEMERRYPPQT